MSIQSSINQAVNGMMSMIMPMSLLKEQGKVKQLKAEQEALKTSNEDLKTSNEDLKKRNEEETKKWDEIIENAPVNLREDAASDFLSYNPYSAGGDMASTIATQRVQSEHEKRKAQMERLQKAFKNIGMGGGNDNG